jgi:uncharacterized membrane protein
MVPLVVLSILFLFLVVSFGWHTALRVGLTGMFLLAASAHWGRRRPDLVRMVPSGFRRPRASGDSLCEILGAIGLLAPPFVRWAAIGLSLLLIAVFPANVRAARERITIGGKPATPLVARSLIQVIFLMSTVAVAIGSSG